MGEEDGEGADDVITGVTNDVSTPSASDQTRPQTRDNGTRCSLIDDSGEMGGIRAHVVRV